MCLQLMRIHSILLSLGNRTLEFLLNIKTPLPLGVTILPLYSGQWDVRESDVLLLSYVIKRKRLALHFVLPQESTHVDKPVLTIEMSTTTWRVIEQ